jgi:hypothetical protein
MMGGGAIISHPQTDRLTDSVWGGGGADQGEEVRPYSPRRRADKGKGRGRVRCQGWHLGGGVTNGERPATKDKM